MWRARVAGATFLMMSLWMCGHRGEIRGQAVPPQSPVRIIGGSITVRVPGQWAPQNSNSFPLTPQGRVTSANFDIKLDNVTPETAGDSTDWPASDPWEVDVYAADAKGMRASTEGLALCTNPGGATCQVPAHTAMNKTVTVTAVRGAMSSAIYDRTDAAKFPNGKKDEGLRFGNTNCTVDDGELCEHMYRIVVTIGQGSPHGYLCPDGDCIVTISGQ
jgi:hypothetical protein